MKTAFPKSSLLDNCIGFPRNAARIGERDRFIAPKQREGGPGRCGARLAPRFFAEKESWLERVWRDAEHCARDARAPRNCRALTILEMLVSTALLAFIVLGLTAMFIQTQKAFKTGIKQTTVTDAGRSIVDMIASDLVQMSDPHFTNVVNQNFAAPALPNPPTLDWSWVTGYDLIQSNLNSSGVLVPFRTNQVEDIFTLMQTNNTWVGIGYAISNWFTNTGTGVAYPGIGTLYRYVVTTNAPLTNGSAMALIYGFQAAVGGNFSNCHRIADGVVHLKINVFDANGSENLNEVNYPNGPLQYPNVVQYPPGSGLYQTNYLPHSIDIELGILEPEAFEHARALFASGAVPTAEQYLSSAANQVEIFRQHIIIPGAP